MEINVLDSMGSYIYTYRISEPQINCPQRTSGFNVYSFYVHGSKRMMTYRSQADATETLQWFPDHTLHPTPGKEDVVRKFIAMGRLIYPDFPFKLKEEEE